MRTKYVASVAVAAATLAAGGIHLAFSQNKNTEACFVQSRAFSTGASACLAINTTPGIEQTCEAHNTWRVRGTCPKPVAPSGRQYDQDDVEGATCLGSGGFYSPGFEGCSNGNYQRCDSDGQWLDRRELQGVKCK